MFVERKDQRLANPPADDSDQEMSDGEDNAAEAELDDEGNAMDLNSLGGDQMTFVTTAAGPKLENSRLDISSVRQLFIAFVSMK